MKNYLKELADEIDVVTTKMYGAKDYQEQIITVIYKYLNEYEITGDVTLDMIMEDMQKAIK